MIVDIIIIANGFKINWNKLKLSLKLNKKSKNSKKYN